MAFRSGHRDASAYAGPAAIFTAPYARLDDTALLRHFSTRRGPHYAPVCEPHFQSDAFVADVMRDRYRFNGETFQLDADFDWTWNPSSDIEWLIMLQKCYHFAGMGLYYERSGDERIRDKWMTLADRWLMQVEPGFIASDVAGRRIQNWIYAFHCFVEAAPQPLPDAAFVRRYLGSLHAQTAWLHNNLTASRNHRTLELHAIFLVALVFPELRDSPAWLEFALSALAQNVSDDFLADGVHCEQSIFYHHVVLRNLLNVQRLAAWNGLPQPAALRSRLRRALRFSLHVHRPDGVVPAFSDGDNASFLDLLESAADLYDDPELGFVASGGRSGRAPRDTLAAFPAAGYYVLRSGWRAEGLPYQQASHVVFDCGPVGRGNHGHLDALSFEYFAGGQALVVDPGRCTYDESGEQNWRVRFRGTAAHNTVEVDGRDQTRYEYVEKYGKFRLTGRGAECELHHVLEGPGGKLVSASVHSHEYTAVHRRDLFLAAAGYLLIVDRLHDAVPRDYALRFQLAPAAQGQVQLTSGDAGVSVTAPGLVLHQLAVPRAVMTVEPSWVAPTYGERLPAPRLRSDVRATRATFVTVLAPDTLSALTLTALHAPAGVVAVRVEHAGGADVCCYAPSGAAHPLVYAGIGCEAEFAHFTSAAGGPARLTMTDVSAAVAIHGETGR